MATMKLQRQLSRKVGSKEYAKWIVVIPPEVIKDLEWKEGQELQIKTKNKKVELETK